jgi:hypothetical protein
MIGLERMIAVEGSGIEQARDETSAEISASISPRSSKSPRSTSLPAHSTSTPSGAGCGTKSTGAIGKSNAPDDPAALFGLHAEQVEIALL